MSRERTSHTIPDEREDRSPGPSVQEVLALDRSPAPPVLREESSEDLGTADLPVDVYVSREFHGREVVSVWRRTWQMACRAEDVASVGDYVVYDIVDDSLIIVRTGPDTLRAYHNSCLHRGTRLRERDGHAQQFRCPFHGFTWTLEGELAEVPCRWDFPHVRDEDFRLPEAKVETWGGFVFVNLDPEAPPLADYLEELPRYFERAPLEDRFVAAHVGKRVDCNWKVAIEAFIEVFHIVGVHPTNLPFFADASSQYDVWPDRRHYSRMVNVSGVPSPHVSDRTTDQRAIDAAARLGMCPLGTRVPEGETARTVLCRSMREQMEAQLGIDTQGYSDSEVLDVIQYNLFPNFVVFAGLGSPLAYRARPWGDDPGACLFEVMLLLPFPDGAERPPRSPLRMLEPGQRWAEAEELSFFGPVLDEDQAIMPRVQRGLRASRKSGISPSRYQEVRIRHFRRTLMEYVEAGGGGG